MAKIGKCPLCGKEVKTGFFGGETLTLNLGERTLECCNECYEKYEQSVGKHKKRFSAKLRSYQYATRRKPTDQELGQMYLTYLAEAKAYAPKSENAKPELYIGGYIKLTEDRRFSVTEHSNDFLHDDVNTEAKAKTMQNDFAAEGPWFTKDDITCIEYASNGIGSPVGLFARVYSYTIRLNSEKTMTYRPCITRATILVKSFLPIFRFLAEKRLVEELNQFKRLIGSDLPVVRGRKR